MVVHLGDHQTGQLLLWEGVVLGQLLAAAVGGGGRVGQQLVITTTLSNDCTQLTSHLWSQ